MKKIKDIFVRYCISTVGLLCMGILIAHSPVLADYSEGCYLAYDREFWR
jgi:hypothetical protein